jgi:hypothetical protein
VTSLPEKVAGLARGAPMPAVGVSVFDRDDVPPPDIQYEVFGPDLWQADFE